MKKAVPKTLGIVFFLSIIQDFSYLCPKISKL